MSATSKSLLELSLESVGPDYNIYRYKDNFFKIVRFKSTAPRSGYIPRDKDKGYKHMDKLSQSLSRARRVCLELALCNDWKWFATMTIAKDNFDRKNLEKFYKTFKEWLKYRREKYGVEIPYLLVPEQHADGSWHLHGFFNSDIDPMLVPFAELDKQGYRSADGKKLPRKLIRNGYYDCPEYRKRFGFCSFGKIRNHDAAAFYAVKYISKSFQGDARRVGLNLYYASVGLNRATFLDSVYGRCSELDKVLVNHYEYCSTGFLRVDREPGDDPLLDIIEQQNDLLFPMSIASDLDEDLTNEVDTYWESAQQIMKGF